MDGLEWFQTLWTNGMIWGVKTHPNFWFNTHMGIFFGEFFILPPHNLECLEEPIPHLVS